MGKGRFDALATIVIASVMVTASAEIIRRAVEEIATGQCSTKYKSKRRRIRRLFCYRILAHSVLGAKHVSNPA